VAVYALFGPTFPGIYDKERGIYSLFYPVSKKQTDGHIVLPLMFEFVLSMFNLFNYCRGYPSSFQFQTSTRTAAMMEKVCSSPDSSEILFIFFVLSDI